MLLFKLAQKVTEFWGYVCSKICRLEPWSTLVEGDEQPYRPQC